MNPHRQEALEITIGAIIFLVVVGVVALVFGPGQLIDDGRYDLRATFGKVDGLKVGGTVMAAGVPVGTVTAMTLTDNFRAATVLRIDRSVELDTDSTAAVVTDGLFGDKYVRLDIGGAESIIPAGGTIGRTTDPVIVDDLLNQIISMGEANLKKSKGE
jgi:phospholipid/cholesterol/gamma-HCH transport system substrate-binding protein